VCGEEEEQQQEERRSRPHGAAARGAAHHEVGDQDGPEKLEDGGRLAAVVLGAERELGAELRRAAEHDDHAHLREEERGEREDGERVALLLEEHLRADPRVGVVQHGRQPAECADPEDVLLQEDEEQEHDEGQRVLEPPRARLQLEAVRTERRGGRRRLLLLRLVVARVRYDLVDQVGRRRRRRRRCALPRAALLRAVIL
jgi:hypothetical protein